MATKPPDFRDAATRKRDGEIRRAVLCRQAADRRGKAALPLDVG